VSDNAHAPAAAPGSAPAPAPAAAAGDSAYERERRAVEALRGARDRITAELRKVVVGQDEVVEQLLVAVLAGGHCLLTGAPGLAKTLLIKSLAQVFRLRFQRIQFTPDLMPADITGTEILQETDRGRRMVFVRGPVFANIILADEINRTPPKTQAALLEAMQELHVTAAGVSHVLERPFFVLATQNPIEMEGTYPLPEAQLDRFMFNVHIDYLPEDDEVKVVLRTTAGEPPPLEALYSGEELLAFQQAVRAVPVAEDVARYAVRLAAASRPQNDGVPAFVRDFIRWGAGLRAAQFLVLGGKARALLEGRHHVTPDDVRALARPVLRHRVLPNYRAEADGVSADNIVSRLIEAVPARP
jgi:MoxR-like ATPase